MITLPSPSALSKFIANIRGSMTSPSHSVAAPAAPRLTALHINTLSQIFDLGDVTETCAWPAAPASGGFPAMPARADLCSATDVLNVPQALLDDLVACGLVQSYGGITDAGLELLSAKDLVDAA